MRKKLCLHALRWIVLLLVLASMPLMAWADMPQMRPAIQALPLRQGETYFSAQATIFSANSEYSGNGARRELFSGQDISEGSFSEFTVNFHYENGITSWITLVADLGYRTLSADYIDLLVRPTDPSRDKTVNSDAFSELWMSGRIRLLKFKTSVGPLVTGFQGGIKIPTGDATLDIPAGTGYIDAQALLLADLDIDLLGPKSYLRGFFGFRLRGGGYAPQQPYSAELGIAVAPELTLRASYNGVMSGGDFDNPVGMDDSRQITIVGDEAYSQASLGLLFAFSSTFSVSFDYVSRVSGKSSMAGDAYLVGFEFR